MNDPAFLARFAAALVRECNTPANAETQLMPSGWHVFSATEEKVVALLLEKGKPMSREQIASALDESADGRIRGIMATLVSRAVCNVTADGYRLNVNTDADRETLRRLLAAHRPADEPKVNGYHVAHN
jgi:hypothetical protein